MARTNPEENSLVTVSTPSTPMTSWPMIRPVKAWLVGSKVARSPADMWLQWADSRALTRTAKPTMLTARIPKPQPVERRVRSLIHSIRVRSENP